MTSPSLLVVLTRRAERQLETAIKWWRTNRPAAPNLLSDELSRAVDLLALQPAIGAKARGERFTGVRRVLLDHGERNHQGLDNVLLKGAPAPANENGRMHRRERLGGLLNYYHRDAA